MDETRARAVVSQLQERGLFAHLDSNGVFSFGIRVALGDGREAIWDSDGAAGLEAQIMQDGMLVGFVPVIAGSESFSDDEVVAAIAATDYDAGP